MADLPGERARREAQGRRMQIMREAIGRSQADFARSAGYESEATISGWEVGRNKMDPVKLQKIAEDHPIDLVYILTGDRRNIPLQYAAEVQRREISAQNAPKPTRGRPRRQPPADPPAGYPNATHPGSSSVHDETS